MEQSSGLRLSTFGLGSSSSEEAPFVLRSPHDSDSSVLASEALVSRHVGSDGGRLSSASLVSRSSQTASLPFSSSRDPQAVSSCLATVQRFAKAEGFSSRVASQIGFARRASSRTNYQVKWSVYRQWCREESHFISQPLLPKIADFLFWLCRSRKLSVSSILGYRSMLSSVFHFKQPEISSSFILKDLLRSFKVEAPVQLIRPPPWDFDAVLRFLISSTFEPLASTSLHSLMKKVLFPVSLATTKRVGELQAPSRYVSFSSSGACVAYVPEFLAKTESALHSLPRSFLVKSLTDFAAGLDQELLLCPVRALREYLRRIPAAVNRPHCLFVSPRTPSRVMSKNGISYFLREVIPEAGASREVGVPLHVHSNRGITTSTAFLKNWSISSVSDAASWQSNSVFASFYLRDLHFEYEGIRSLGPFVAAG